MPFVAAYFQYYDGNPPEVIRHGSPWPDANFVWVKETTETSQGVFLIPVVSDVPGTREMREISVGLRTSRGLVLIAGCSHPGIEKILEAARPIRDRVLCIFGGLHLVLTKEPEIRRVVSALRDDWHVESIAPVSTLGSLPSQPYVKYLANAAYLRDLENRSSCELAG